MRTIKFRGQIINSDVWVYGYLREIWASKQENCRYIICPSMKYLEDGWTDLEEVEVKPETVGQFTGLQDKNGVDIYEGDIGVRFLDKDKRCTDGKTWRDYWEVEWDGVSTGFITTMIADYDTRYDKVVKTPRNSNPYSRRFNEIEVIGNIHQNPELL